MSSAKGLIRLAAGRAITERMTQGQVRKRMLRPRVLAYLFILWLIMVGCVVSLATRTTLRMDVIRDRGVLGREVAGGMIENVFRVQFINTSESPVVPALSAKGLTQLSIVLADRGASTVKVKPGHGRQKVRARAYQHV